MSDLTSSEASPSQDQPEITLDEISAELAVLIPEVKKLRRSRWLARGVAVALVLVVAIGIAGAATYVQDRNDDREQRAVRRVANEQALVRECEASADQTADLRTAFNVLLGVAAQGADDPAEVEALVDQINVRLDEAVPPRDCPEEARVRAEGG